MTIKALLSELHTRLHAAFEAKNEHVDGKLITTKDTRLTDEATDADVQEIATLAAQHAADIHAGK